MRPLVLLERGLHTATPPPPPTPDASDLRTVLEPTRRVKRVPASLRRHFGEDVPPALVLSGGLYRQWKARGGEDRIKTNLGPLEVRDGSYLPETVPGEARPLLAVVSSCKEMSYVAG